MMNSAVFSRIGSTLLLVASLALGSSPAQTVGENVTRAELPDTPSPQNPTPKQQAQKPSKLSLSDLGLSLAQTKLEPGLQ
jgi:hypothetical protein